MDGFFPLDIFPVGALSSSVITTVWVGVLVVAVLNLRLGTTLSGLVVPGYLVPLILLRPMSAGVILLEGVITFTIAHLLAERLPKLFSHSEVFGRDRFFALILISIIVRLIFDGMLLPELGEYLLNQGFDYDYRNNLHSFGLIIVALIANQMWNGGIRIGAVSIALYIGITYIIVRFVLMEFTNFNISTMSYMYEDLASSILASPKAYIILLTSAYIASRMNLKYGWEFNGILIPSLLALQWYQPDKLIITFVEAMIVYSLSASLLKTKFFKQMNIEGAREILFFFNVSFLYKMILGFFLIEFFPNQKVSDFYAFGYLLSTLIAIKMYQKGIAIRMARATLQTSLSAVILASIIGFSLTLIPEEIIDEGEYIAESNQNIEKIEGNFEQYLGKLRSSLYTSEQTTQSGQANPIELNKVNKLFQLTQNYLQNPSETLTVKMLTLSSQLNLKISELNKKYLIIEDMQPARGWGVYIFNLETDSKLSIEVPASLDEPLAIDAALILYVNLAAKGFALAGTKRKHSADGTSDTLQNSQTPFQLFHRNFGLQDTLQVRNFTPESGRRLLGVKTQNISQTINLDRSQLWVKKTLPENLNINMLDNMMSKFEIHWKSAPLENRQQDASPKGFAELFLTPAGVKSILSFSSTGTVFNEQRQTQRIDGYLLNWLKDNKKLIAAKGSNDYKPAEVYEMLFLDQNVITPIMSLLAQELASGWRDDISLEMRRINNLARALDYELIRYHHQSSGDDFLILQEYPSKSLRHWGTFIFRVGQAQPYVIEVPRPLSEINTLEFGAGLFEKLNARALLIAGTHPFSNFDGSANLLHSANKINLFNLVHQVILRQTEDSPMMVTQLRAFSSEDNTPSLSTDILLAKLGTVNESSTVLTQPIDKALKEYGLNVQYVTGTSEARGYEVSWNAQARYSPFTQNKSFYVLWVSPKTRSSFLDQEDNRQQQTKFLTLGVTTKEVDIPSWSSENRHAVHQISPIYFSPLKTFFLSENVVLLKHFFDKNKDYIFERLIDINTRQAYLAISLPKGGLLALVNLQTHNEKKHYLPRTGPPSLVNTQTFVDERARWLLRGKDK
ncbi:MAG: poly-gamma-glutamate biosynthesis protein PgsC/CapC [Bermanella sp.]